MSPEPAVFCWDWEFELLGFYEKKNGISPSSSLNFGRTAPFISVQDI